MRREIHQWQWQDLLCQLQQSARPASSLVSLPASTFLCSTPFSYVALRFKDVKSIAE